MADPHGPAYSTVERAFQLARSGAYATLKEIELRLRQEGYLDASAHTRVPGVRKQLQAALRGEEIAPMTKRLRPQRPKRRSRMLTPRHHV